MHLNRPAKDMWDNVLQTFRGVLTRAEAAYMVKAKSFNSTEDENTTSLATLRKRAWLALRAKVDEQIADQAFLSKLRNHFEERFRYDDAGVPRVWKPEDDIDGAFKKAKDQVRTIIHWTSIPYQ